MIAYETGWLKWAGVRVLTWGGIVAGLLSVGSLQASLDAYGVFKGEHYFQASANAPGAAEVGEYGVKAFVVTAEGYTPFLLKPNQAGPSRLRFTRNRSREAASTTGSRPN
jgi:hypothetical protein